MKAPRPTRPTVPVLAKGKTDTGRLWIYVRDDQPFGGTGPPAALFYASRDRTRRASRRRIWPVTPAFCRPTPTTVTTGSIFADRKPGPIVEALCWSHARRKFFELADIAANARRRQEATPISPIAFEAVRRIDALFDIEREINGLSAAESLGCAPGEEHAPGRGAGSLDARRARQTLPARCSRQGDRLHAHALAGLHSLP